jgi:AcrR family transcriptional regulator
VETEPTRRMSALQRQQRQLTVDALVQAARQGMSEHGLDVTVDEIAALAEVGRATVFRHFPTREDLLQAAIEAIVNDYLRSIPAYPGGDWRAWLTDLTRVAHQSAVVAGRLVLELRTRRLPPRLAAVLDEHRQALKQMYATTAATLWEAAAGNGPPPPQLRQTVAVHLSPLFTQIVLVDADATAERGAELAATAIAGTLHQLLTP